MTQFGIHTPGGPQSKGNAPDVYTALMFLAVVAMGVAVAMLWIASSKVAPEGNPLKIQEPHKIHLKS